MREWGNKREKENVKNEKNYDKIREREREREN